MARTFLTAEWRNLLMANYEIDPVLLKKYIPWRTELDDFNGVHYVSLVGFMFQKVKVYGISLPYHRDFEEVNLRFYVRYKDSHQWKRGVVFIKEIVPRRMISFVANTLYGEKYITLPMDHKWETSPGGLKVCYRWKVGGEWNFMRAVAKNPEPLKEGSEAAFITEHYWGYTQMKENATGVYEVEHPSWRVHPVEHFEVHCNTARLYGKAFENVLATPPRSVFLAEGSPVKVLSGSKILLKSFK